MRYPNIDKEKKTAENIIHIMKQQPCDDSELQAWSRNDPQFNKTLNNLSDANYVRSQIDAIESCRSSSDSNRLRTSIRNRKRRSRIIALSTVAAMLIGISFAITYMLFSTNQQICMQPSTEIPQLILASGVSVDLTKIDSSMVINHVNHIEINNLKEVTSAQLSDNLNDNLINKYVIPRKYTGEIVLSDSTVVYLNSQSILLFPTRFSGERRDVTLQGEAYFEVAKSDKPFVVTVDGMHVKVYGTKFNINAYESHNVETILFEGAVGINCSTNQENEIRLLPNDLFKINLQTGVYKKIQVRPYKYMAWTNNEIMCENDNFSVLINELSRWYNVNFTFIDSSLMRLPITAIFSKDSTIEDIIETIEILDSNIIFTEEKGGYTIRKGLKQ